MDHHLVTQIIQQLESGKNSVLQIRDLFNQIQGTPDHHHQDCSYRGLDHCSMALTALDSVLSIFHDSDNFRLPDSKFAGNCQSNYDQASAGETLKKDRRGCYKRRRSVEAKEVESTNLTDDGFAWRKYGQKEILNTTYPRHYYRCTHKHDEGCQATKQVQQISDDPVMYRTIYHGNHTCKSTHKTLTPLFLDSNPENHNSSIFLSFESNPRNIPPPKQVPNFLPTSYPVKQEHGPIKVETPSLYTSSPSSPDPTITTPRSEISSAEVYSSVASSHGLDTDEFLKYLSPDPLDLDQALSYLCGDHDHDLVYGYDAAV